MSASSDGDGTKYRDPVEEASRADGPGSDTPDGGGTAGGQTLEALRATEKRPTPADEEHYPDENGAVTGGGTTSGLGGAGKTTAGGGIGPDLGGGTVPDVNRPKRNR